MNLTFEDVLNSDNCPKELKESEMRSFDNLTPNKVIVVFSWGEIGLGTLIVASGLAGNVCFGKSFVFTYHSITSPRLEVINPESINVSFDFPGMNGGAKLKFLVSDDEVCFAGGV